MLNKVILMGRLTANPELRRTTSGTDVATFTVAVDRKYKDQNGDRQTDFLNCVAWRGTATFVEKYFKKGQQIIVEGSIQNRSYEKDGQKRYITEIIAENAFFAGEKKESDTTYHNSTPDIDINPDDFVALASAEDVPF